MTTLNRSGFMLDTTVFNNVVDGTVDVGAFNGCRVFVTHVQRDELVNTCNAARRSKLLQRFEIIAPKSLATEGFVLGISRLDHAKLSENGELYTRILNSLRTKDPKRKSMKFGNQERDSLIAETAISNGLAFITNDNNLCEVVREIGGSAITLDEFLNRNDP